MMSLFGGLKPRPVNVNHPADSGPHVSRESMETPETAQQASESVQRMNGRMTYVPVLASAIILWLIEQGAPPAAGSRCVWAPQREFAH